MDGNISEISYEACWTENDGMWSCGCGHKTIREAVGCMTRDGRSFVRAIQNGVTRFLNDDEFPDFLQALGSR